MSSQKPSILKFPSVLFVSSWCRLLLVALPLLAASCGKDPHPRVIVIGFDGMDPRLCEKLMSEGRLPALAKMRDAGGYKPLGTSIPPQSPVAWSNFITGADPGVHGIFDFLHREPSKQIFRYYSAAKTEESTDGWEVGRHRLPLTFWPFNHNPTQTLLQRHGTPFWDYLDKAGIPARIYDIPSNYPPSESKHGHMCCLAGMGVPDLLGTYGTYQFFAESTVRAVEDDGGNRYRIAFRNDMAKAVLIGPKNTALKNPVQSKIEFEIFRSPSDPAARIEIQGQTVALKEGEWSEWVRLSFELQMPSFLPTTRVPGIVRFYLQQVRPDFRLYISPINIDPSDPGDQKISEPPDFINEISDTLGLFYTAGFQEDHKALSHKVFNEAEYHAQARHVLNERLNLLEYATTRYEEEGGFLFFYFSGTDLQAHMFWWEGNDHHPTRSPELARQYHGVIEQLYTEMDRVVGEIVEFYGQEAAILVMSDHGFSNFQWQFDLNTWLRNEGYIQPPTAPSLFSGIDWSKTRAYGLGLNGLYLNLKGRERDGSVDPAERSALLDEISQKLLAIRDPKNGRQVISKVYRSDEVYRGPYAASAPDLIVGYARGYRASWKGAAGDDIGGDVIFANDQAWSADHCMAAEEVPGVIFANRPIQHPAPSLVDMAPTILSLYGIDKPADMTGRSLFEMTATTKADANR